MYTIKNQQLFGACYAGALSGMLGQGLGSDTVSVTAAQYAQAAQIAFAYAQEFDTITAAGPQSSLVYDSLLTLSEEAFRDRNPTGASAATLTTLTTPATWLPLVNGLTAVLTESAAVVTAGASNPPTGGGNATLNGKNAAATALATTTTYDVSADVAGGYIPKTSGTLTFTCTMSVLDATVDDPVTFQLRIAAAADAADDAIPTSAGHVTANAWLTKSKSYPCTAGTAINPGMQAVSAAGHNVQAAIGSISWTITENQSQ
jgi:hypothetical protein